MAARVVFAAEAQNFKKTVLARIANKVADIKDVTGFLADRSPVPLAGRIPPACCGICIHAGRAKKFWCSPT